MQHLDHRRRAICRCGEVSEELAWLGVIMNIHEMVHRAGPYIALAGTVVVVAGVLFNCSYFFFLDRTIITTLTVGDHLSTAAGTVPYYCLAIGLGMALGHWSNDTPVANQVRSRGFAYWLYLVQAVLLLAIGIIFQAAWLTVIAATTLLSIGMIWASRRSFIASYDRATRMTLLALSLATLGLCGYGVSLGLALLDQQTADVTISTEGHPREPATMIGVYDRGSFFLLKPSNKLVFVSQRTNLVVEAVRERPQDLSRGTAARTWVRRHLGMSD